MKQTLNSIKYIIYELHVTVESLYIDTTLLQPLQCSQYCAREVTAGVGTQCARAD